MTNIIQFPKRKRQTLDDHYDAACSLLNRYKLLANDSNELIETAWMVDDFNLWREARLRRKQYKAYVELWQNIVNDLATELRKRG